MVSAHTHRLRGGAEEVKPRGAGEHPHPGWTGMSEWPSPRGDVSHPRHRKGWERTGARRGASGLFGRRRPRTQSGRRQDAEAQGAGDHPHPGTFCGTYSHSRTMGEVPPLSPSRRSACHRLISLPGCPHGALSTVKRNWTNELGGKLAAHWCSEQRD